VTNDHLVLRNDQRFAYTADPIEEPYRPSVTTFYESAVQNWPRAGVAVLLTGMGNDGAKGMATLRQAGWFTIAQDQSTCVVYGMPKAAAELNAASRVLPLPLIAGTIQLHWKEKG
jgi:chemotaxis response regulator CheB